MLKSKTGDRLSTSWILNESMDLTWSREEKSVRYLLQKAKLLDLSFKFGLLRQLEGLHEILSPIAPTLEALGLTIPLYVSTDR